MTVVSEQRWRLAAVAGAASVPSTPEELANQLVARGLEALIGSEMLSATGSSELRWRPGGD